MITGLEMPTRAVPPTSLESISFLKFFSPPDTIRAASLVIRFFLNIFLISRARNRPVPSMVFRKMFPE